MADEPVELDNHRGMAAQKATDLRRTMAGVETNAKDRRERQSEIEARLFATRAGTWLEAAAKARYVLSLYAASLDPKDTHHRDLIARVLDDFVRLADAQESKQTSD